MRGNLGRRLRKEGAVKRVEAQILNYEQVITSNKESLKVARKEKDQANINTCETIVGIHEKKLNAARECLENTKNNLR
jgi:DNA-binding ferritin-like protein